MAKNYSKEIPHDKDGEPQHGLPPAVRALARYGDDDASVSSVITLTDDTTTIELAAVGGAAVMRWVLSADTSASVVSAQGSTPNFDHVISANTVRRFVVPKELGARQTSVVGYNVENGLFKRVAIKSVGIASVLTTEY